MEPLINFKPEVYQEPKKLAELQLRDRNFCGDFNARNKENSKNSNLDNMSYCQTKDEEESTKSCV